MTLDEFLEETRWMSEDEYRDFVGLEREIGNELECEDDTEDESYE